MRGAPLTRQTSWPREEEVAAQRHGCPVRRSERILAAVGPWLQQRAQHRLSSARLGGGSERTPAAARSGVDRGEVSGGPQEVGDHVVR